MNAMAPREVLIFSVRCLSAKREREKRRGEKEEGREGERERADNQRSLSRGRELEKLCEILRTEWDKGTEREREREREKKNFPRGTAAAQTILITRKCSVIRLQ